MTGNNENTRRQESSVLPKLRQWYTDFAVLFLNTVMTAVVALVVLSLLAVLIGAFKSERVYSRRFIPESYELSTAEEVRQIGREFDQMGERESYAYNPWTTFTERPFRGELLNIEETQSYPTRATIHQPPSKLAADQEDLLIWTFGGSTMLGWGVSDKNTVASHLQRELQNALPRYRIRIVNHGHAYYFSSLEVSLCIALLRKDEQPDIIVFLDGLNDVIRISAGHEEPYFAPQAAAGWEAERRRRYYPSSVSWFSVNANFPVYRFLRQLHLMNPEGSTKAPNKQLGKDEAVRRVVEIMNMNRDIASATTKKLGIQAFFFLQPISQRRREKEIFARAYPALREATKSHPDFYDISEPLEGALKHPYVDKAHYSDRGSLLVAQRIAKTILHSSNLQQRE